MKTLFTKTGITDDAAPSGAPGSLTAGRPFGIPGTYDSAKTQPTCSLNIALEFLTSAGVVVAGVSCSVQLWLCDTSVPERPLWVKVGPPATGLVAGTLYSLPLPALESGGVQAFLQVTAVAGGAPAVVVARAMFGGPLSQASNPATGAALVWIASKGAGENTTDDVTSVQPKITDSVVGAAAKDNTSALFSSRQIKAAAGRLYKARVGNGTGGVAGWVMWFNSSGAPVNGAVPIWRRAIGTAGSEVNEDFASVGGLAFANSLYCVLSTTEVTLTIGAATLHADHLVG